jgi:hypothetical protein
VEGLLRQGGRHSVLSGRSGQREVFGVEERTGCSSVRRLAGTGAFLDFGEQDRHPLRSFGRRVAVFFGSEQLHHGQRQGESRGDQHETYRGVHVQYRSKDGVRRGHQVDVPVHQVDRRHWPEADKMWKLQVVVDLMRGWRLEVVGCTEIDVQYDGGAENGEWIEIVDVT